MSAASTTARAAPSAPAIAVRHPVRVDTDGDFALEDLLALPDTGSARSTSAAEATRAALWRPETPDFAGFGVITRPCDIAEHDAPTEDDAVLLHRIETAGLFRPPVREHLPR